MDGMDWTTGGKGKPTARGAYIYPPGLDSLDSTTPQAAVGPPAKRLHRTYPINQPQKAL